MYVCMTTLNSPCMHAFMWARTTVHCVKPDIFHETYSACKYADMWARTPIMQLYIVSDHVSVLCAETVSLIT